MLSHLAIYTLIGQFLISKGAAECDPDCNNRNKNCVTYSGEKGKKINCENPKDYNKCPVICGACTPCEYVIKSEFDEEVSPLEAEISVLHKEVSEIVKTSIALSTTESTAFSLLTLLKLCRSTRFELLLQSK